MEVTGSGVSELFDFLKASPTLRTVDITTNESIVLEGIPQQMAVILPNVEVFSLASSTDVYGVAAHVSCPRAKNTSLRCEIADYHMAPGRGVFPTSTTLNTIVHQYTRSPVEEVALEINPTFDTCSLIFQTSDASTIRLLFHVLDVCDEEDELEMTLDEIAWEVFSQGLDTIQALPQLSHIKQLRIGYMANALDPLQVTNITAQLSALFGSMGALDRLTIDGGDQSPYFGGFGNFAASSFVFPPIKELTILRPSMDERHMGAIVELAKSQHAKGVPFERVTVRARMLPAVMVEELRQWVGAVDC